MGCVVVGAGGCILGRDAGDRGRLRKCGKGSTGEDRCLWAPLHRGLERGAPELGIKLRLFLRKEMGESILSVLHSLGKRQLGSVLLCRVFICGCSGWQWVSTQLSKHRGGNICLCCFVDDIKPACFRMHLAHELFRPFQSWGLIQNLKSVFWSVHLIFQESQRSVFNSDWSHVLPKAGCLDVDFLRSPSVLPTPPSIGKGL